MRDLYLKENQHIFKGNLIIWTKLWIFTNTEFNLLKKEFEEFRQQSKNLESENRALEQLVEILKDPVITTF